MAPWRYVDVLHSIYLFFAELGTWIFYNLLIFHLNLFLSKQISTPVRVQGLEQVRLIAVGAFHNLALLEDGVLWAWGNNEYGQLGTGDTQPRSQPIPVQGLSDLTLVCTTKSTILLYLVDVLEIL